MFHHKGTKVPGSPNTHIGTIYTERGNRSSRELRFLRCHTHNTVYIETPHGAERFTGERKPQCPDRHTRAVPVSLKQASTRFVRHRAGFSFGGPSRHKKHNARRDTPERCDVSYKIYVSSVLLAQNHVAIVFIQNQRVGAVSRCEGGEIACYTELWNGSRRMYRIALNNLNLKGYNIEVSVEGQLRRYRRDHPGLSHRVAGDGRSCRALYRTHRQPRREGARALTVQPLTRKQQKRDFHHTGRNPSFVILSCAPPAPGPDAAGYLPRPLCWPFFPPCHFIMARGNFIWAFLNLKSCSLERKLLNLS